MSNLRRYPSVSVRRIEVLRLGLRNSQYGCMIDWWCAKKGNVLPVLPPLCIAEDPWGHCQLLDDNYIERPIVVLLRWKKSSKGVRTIAYLKIRKISENWLVHMISGRCRRVDKASADKLIKQLLETHQTSAEALADVFARQRRYLVGKETKVRGSGQLI